jgi:hypothetical protein
MTRRLCVFVLTMLLLTASASAAQQDTLTPDLIAQAVRAGALMKPGDVGLLLRFSAWARALNRDSDSMAQNVVVTLYTPVTWIQLMSAMAASEFRELSEVSEDMKEPILRVFIKPAVAGHLVLRDPRKRVAIQPSANRMCDRVMPFGSNEIEQYCQEFRFPLDAVNQLRAGNGEFVVTVLLRGVDLDNPNRQIQSDWDFAVNRGHLNKLPGLGGR